MAHSLSAKKRIRQNAKRHSRNNRCRRRIRTAVRAFDEALSGGDRDQAARQLQTVYKTLDQVAAKGTIHKNAAARKKSRLARRMDRAFSS
ncbi:MAG: 30S ribosomal protein S20 [Planctomycetota bacterium]